MVALAATGRRSAALAIYQELRERLSAELGISPGAESAGIHLRILREADQPAGAGPRASASRPAAVSPPAAGQGQPAGRSHAVVPRQLPRPIPGFVGRAQPLGQLSAALDAADRAGSPLPVWVISGPAGVGKSTLVLHWAHQVAHRFPDGQLHVDLRGFDPSAAPPSSEHVIRRLLGTLQVPAERMPASLDAQVDLYRSLLADRRVLVVLDNARDPDQVRLLLPAGAGCQVLVTSRDRLLGLAASHGARLLGIEVFTDAEAQELLIRRVPGRAGPDEAAAAGEIRAASEIIALCGRLPLALAIVAARAQAHRSWSLVTLAGDLRGTPARLDALDAGDDAASVRAVFSWSYRELTPAAARVFRLLGLHPGPDISVRAVASLAAVTLPDARRLTAELTRLHLLTEHVPQRYALHDLLRAYAAEELRDYHSDDNPSGERPAAARRVLDYYLQTAHSAALALNPARDRLEIPPPAAGTAPDTITRRGAADDWFRAEYHVLVPAIDLAVGAGLDDHAWQLAWTLGNFLDQEGHWADWIATHQTALRAAERSESLLGQAAMHQNLSIVYVHLGRYDDAHAHLRRAVTCNSRLGSPAGQARCLLDLARACECQDRYAEALEHASAALRLYEELGHQVGQARALNAIGWNCAHLGDSRAAVSSCTRALEIHVVLGHRMGQAATLDSLGYAHTQLGEYAQAIGYYERALDLLGQSGRTFQHACVLADLAASYHAARDGAAAADAGQRALSILQALEHPDYSRVLSRLTGAGVPIRAAAYSR
jgi:tetratricopeptide (TPR) repeat protein